MNSRNLLNILSETIYINISSVCTHAYRSYFFSYTTGAILHSSTTLSPLLFFTLFNTYWTSLFISTFWHTSFFNGYVNTLTYYCYHILFIRTPRWILSYDINLCHIYMFIYIYSDLSIYIDAYIILVPAQTHTYIHT